MCDQDAYACSGQKCSAQSILFMHEVRYNKSFVDTIAEMCTLPKNCSLILKTSLIFSLEIIVQLFMSLTELG